MNDKDGTFCDGGDLAGPAIREPRVSRGLAAADLDNDGNVDLVIENLDGIPTILHNNGIPGNHWVSFELGGIKSNRLAIGARVTLTSGGMTQMDEVRSGGSYLSQNDLRLHFGLGKADKIDAVEIRWPSGRVDRMSNLRSDQFYSVLEGTGMVDHSAIAPPKK